MSQHMNQFLDIFVTAKLRYHVFSNIRCKLHISVMWYGNIIYCYSGLPNLPTHSACFPILRTLLNSIFVGKFYEGISFEERGINNQC